MSDCLTQYFRCPEDYVNLGLSGSPSERDGYFRFGDSICYGRCGGLRPSSSSLPPQHEGIPGAVTEDGTVTLPFDSDEIVKNLTQERYSHSNGNGPIKLNSPAN